MISAKVTIEVHIVNSGLFGELISLSHLLRVHAFPVSSIILHTLHSLIELILEHFDGLKRFPKHKLSKPRVERSQLIHVNIESVRSTNNSSNLLLTLLVIQIVLNHFLHL
jgi:hypothetical protein